MQIMQKMKISRFFDYAKNVKYAICIFPPCTHPKPGSKNPCNCCNLTFGWDRMTVTHPLPGGGGVHRPQPIDTRAMMQVDTHCLGSATACQREADIHLRVSSISFGLANTWPFSLWSSSNSCCWRASSRAGSSSWRSKKKLQSLIPMPASQLKKKKTKSLHQNLHLRYLGQPRLGGQGVSTSPKT